MHMNKVIRNAALVFAASLIIGPAALWSQIPVRPAARTNGGLRPPSEKELIYVTLPGTLEGAWDQNGTGIIVLDAANNFNFVKRIPTWEVPASGFPEQIAGVTASTDTQMIYLATRGRLAAFDLKTEKKVWENVLDGECCERPQMAPDSSFMYVGSDLKDYWYVVNPKDGTLITTVHSPQSMGAHNLNLSADGKTAFMAPNGKVMGIADTTNHSLVKTIPFPDNVRVFVVNHDSSLIYTNQNNLLGYLVADVKTGQIVQKVEVTGFPWHEKWDVTPRPRIPHGCPSHGIALVNNEKEVWLCDGLNDYIHIFDNTVSPAKQIADIKTSHGPYWLTPGLDGKLIYCSSGDVIDTKSRQIVGHLKDEYGRPLYSEKVLDMLFVNGKLTRVSNQFGNGTLAMGDGPGTATTEIPMPGPRANNTKK
jgi:DNA-binding beta-propeller fold protein YncE